MNISSGRSLSILKILGILFVLNLMLVLPSWIERLAYMQFFRFDETRDIFNILWVSVDLILILLVIFIVRSARYKTGVVWGVVGIYLAIFGFEWYSAAIRIITHRKPLIYNDLFLLDDAWYLLMDLFTTYWFRFLLAAATMLFVVVFLIPFLFDQLGELFAKAKSHRLIYSIFLLLIGLSITLHQSRGLFKRDVPIQFISSRLKHQIYRSIDLRRTLVDGRFAKRISRNEIKGDNLNKKPNVYLFVIESYGAVLNNDLKYRTLMTRFDSTLSSGGFKTTTRLSKAPVSGQGSWLSLLTVLSGVPIRNQVEYQYYTDHFSPQLINIFRQNRYQTVLLQPANRPRPGIPLGNPYRFHVTINKQDLQYQGGRFGWGILPDQYSILKAEEQVLTRLNTPIFFCFTTVSSHTPWTENTIPPYLKNLSDPESINYRLQNLVQENHDRSSRAVALHDSGRNGRADLYMLAIQYEFRVLTDFIQRSVASDDLVIIIGDHQPPLLSINGENNTPLHFITGDTQLIPPLINAGFSRGMMPVDSNSESYSHADISKTLIQLLKR